MPGRFSLATWAWAASLMLAAACGAAAETLVIDAFDYPTAQAVQKAWQPQNDSPPMELMPGGHGDSGRAATLRCDWSRTGERVYYDRRVNLDLTRLGRITLWVYADYPDQFRGGTIYFQSSEGWYAGWFLLNRSGWQQITMDRLGFGEEGSPAGWHEIQTVRLSLWKAPEAAARAATVAVDQLEAHSVPIVVVRGDLTIRSESPEAQSVQRYAANVARLLGRSGLDFTVINDTDVERGALAQAKLAIFAYNPHMSEQELQAARAFIGAGGKVMVFYSLPWTLAEPLGVVREEWTNEQYPGQFAAVSLDGKLVEGMPKSIQQSSWNIFKIRPVSDQAKVVGHWVDAKGRSTGIPAVTIGPGGLYMGHVLTEGDDAAKQRFLLAATAALVPEWKATLGRDALRRAVHLEGLGGIAELRQLVESHRDQVSADRLERSRNLLAEAERVVRQAEDRLAANAPQSFASALAAADQAQQALSDAFLLSVPPWRPGFRALWCHSAFGVSGWSWDESARYAKDNGFNALVVNMLWAGRAYYPSKVLPVAAEVEKRGDQIAQCLAACRKYGLQLHVWKVNYNLSGAPKGFVDRLRRQGRLQADRDGREVLWLDPSHPDNFRLECDSMLELVRNYDVDGIHFDYIRYPHNRADYSDGARKRFAESAGLKIERWPDDVVSGPHAKAFGDWRREQITRLVREVSAQAHRIRPGVKVSAAAFSNYPSCRDTIGQDWVAWVRAGYLDFVCPMDYFTDDGRFREAVESQLHMVDGMVPVYPGVGASASSGRLTAVATARQLMIARELGAPGFIIFNYDRALADSHLPALAKGILAP